jgi:PAS domain S-box-containing protein
MASIEPFPEPRFPWPHAYATPSGGNVVPLREHELRYRALLNALPAAIYTTDAAGRLTFYNEACVAFSGRRPEIGTDSWCVTWRLYRTDGSPLPHDQCPMAVALKEGRPIRGEEAVAERPDGVRIPFIPYPTPFFDENGVVVGAINMLVDISHRKVTEDRLKLLSDEVNHRANNLLTVVQAMVRVTQGETVEQYRTALDGRIHALARAHGLVAESRWQGADLHRLVSEELAPYVGAEQPRVWVSGPATPLKPSTAQSMALVIHELATNAAKYGALSTPGGEVRASWSEPDGGLCFVWTESGGPLTRAPLKRGVGTHVIESAVRQLGGRVRIDWRPEGLVCEITSSL